jgi:hypothetical protein
VHVVRKSLLIVVLLVPLVLAGPAQASKAVQRPSDDALRARAAFCVPCAAAAAAAAVRIARAIKASRAAQKLRAAGRLLRAAPGRGVSITKARVRIVRNEARRVSARGKDWVQRNWERLTPYVRACIGGVGSLEASEILVDGYMTLSEWKSFLTFRLGVFEGNYLDDGYRALYDARGFDLSKKVDAWLLACAGGMAWRGVTG